MRGLGQPNSMPDLQTNDSVVDLSSRIDSAINSEAANNLNQQQSHEREVLDWECASVKDQLLCTTKEQTTELASELPEQSTESFSSISEFLNVNNLGDVVKELTEDGLNLDIIQYLGWLVGYIKNDLSSLNPQIKEKIILSLSVRISKLWKEIQKIKKELRKKIAKKGWNENDLSSGRWEINKKIQNTFQEITNKILPSAFMKQEWDNVENKDAWVENVVGNIDYKEYTVNHVSTMWLYVPPTTFTIEDQMNSNRSQLNREAKEIDEMFGSKVDTNTGQFDERWFNNREQLYTLQLNNELSTKRFQSMGWDASKLSEITLLNEDDQQKESNLMIGKLLLIGPMLLPVVWTAASVPADLISLLTGEDPMLKALKKINPEFDDYYEEDSPLERAFGALGIVLSAGWAQWLAKSWKLADIWKSLSRMPPHMITKSFVAMWEKMWISPEMIKKIKDMFLWTGEKAKSSSKMKSSMEGEELTAYNKEISAAYTMVDGKRASTGVAPQHVQDTNAMLEDIPRLKKADDLLWTKLDTKTQDVILEVHNMKVEDIIKPGDKPKSPEELERLLNIRKGIKLRKAGLEENQVRILMDQKICWLPDDAGKNLDDLDDAWDISPEEIGNALSQWLKDTFSSLAWQPIHKELTDVIDAWDLTSEAWKEVVKGKILSLLKSKYDDLQIQWDAILNWTQSSKRVTDAPVVSWSKALSSLRFEKSDLVNKQNELMRILDKGDLWLKKLELDQLDELEGLWKWLSQNKGLVRAHAKLKEIWLFEVSWFSISEQITDTLKQARLKLKQEKAKRAWFDVIPTAYQEAAGMYKATLNWKIEDARMLIWESDAYQDIMLSLFPWKNLSDLSMWDIRKLAGIKPRITRQAHLYNINKASPALGKASQNQKDLSELIDEISSIQDTKDVFIARLLPSGESSKNQRMLDLWQEIQISDVHILELEESIKALENLQDVWDNTFENIQLFNRNWWEEALNMLSSSKSAWENFLSGVQNDVETIVSTISDVDGKIAQEQIKLSRQAKPSVSTPTQSLEEVAQSRAQIRALWNKVLQMLS